MLLNSADIATQIISITLELCHKTLCDQAFITNETIEILYLGMYYSI